MTTNSLAVPSTGSIAQADEGRWREWQTANALGARKGASRARMAFTIIFIAIGVWLGLQLLSAPF